MRSWVVVAAAYMLVWVLLSPVALALVLLNAAAAALVQALHLLGAFQRRAQEPKRGRLPSRLAPFVSVQVPAYDEPPELLAKTVRALAALEHPNFEVLVLDNNTPDPAAWRPIEKLCRELGPRFRFFHFDKWKERKLGRSTSAWS